MSSCFVCRAPAEYAAICDSCRERYPITTAGIASVAEGADEPVEATFTHDPRAWDHALAYVQHMVGTLTAAAEQHMQLLAQSIEAMSARYDAITQVGAELEQLRAEVQETPEDVAELPERIRAVFEKWYEESVNGE